MNMCAYIKCLFLCNPLNLQILNIYIYLKIYINLSSLNSLGQPPLCFPRFPVLIFLQVSCCQQPLYLFQQSINVYFLFFAVASRDLVSFVFLLLPVTDLCNNPINFFPSHSKPLSVSISFIDFSTSTSTFWTAHGIEKVDRMFSISHNSRPCGHPLNLIAGTLRAT